jgi:hypothetical protein
MRPRRPWAGALIAPFAVIAAGPIAAMDIAISRPTPVGEIAQLVVSDSDIDVSVDPALAGSSATLVVDGVTPQEALEQLARSLKISLRLVGTVGERRVFALGRAGFVAMQRIDPYRARAATWQRATRLAERKAAEARSRAAARAEIEQSQRAREAARRAPVVPPVERVSTVDASRDAIEIASLAVRGWTTLIMVMSAG